jgi:DNA replication protein DnaC
MMNQATVNKLHDMRLSAMAEAYREQAGNSKMSTLSFDERLGMMVDFEWNRRKSNHLNRLIRKAGLHFPEAAVEDVEYHADRKLDHSQIFQLSECNYIGEKHNIILLGASGAGKTWLACAFGMAACRNYYSAKYIRLPDLLNEMAVARGEGQFIKAMKVYKKVSLLILDEWMLLPLTDTQSRDVLEIVEARHQTGSTIFCSQFNPEGWHSKIGESTLADAILDRIVHNSYTIFIDGDESMRQRKGISK